MIGDPTTMQPLKSLNQFSVQEIVDQIFASRRITRIDQQKLMTSLLSRETLTLQEHEQIDKVFDALRRGVIRVVD